jgi:predicted nucleic acid-binding protein
MSLFVDTSIWYAAGDRGDRSNGPAKRILRSGEALVTTDHILVECWMLFRHRISRIVAERFWERLRLGVAVVEDVTLADLEVAWSIGQSYPDHDFSIIDRTSFAVMQRLGVHRAATLDSDFAVYRFGPGRRRAFTVVR